MPEPRIEFLDLSLRERLVAASVVHKVGAKFTWERVLAIFRALARGEALCLEGLDLEAKVKSTLMRRERVMAASVLMAFTFELPDDESVARVVECLGNSEELFAAMVCAGLMSMSVGDADKWPAQMTTEVVN